MPDNYGQIRWDHPSFDIDTLEVAQTLADTGMLVCRMAALSTAYDIVAIDAAKLAPSRCWHGPDGIGQTMALSEYTLWTRASRGHERGLWLLHGGHHHPSYFASKDVAQNERDATPLAAFITRVDCLRVQHATNRHDEGQINKLDRMIGDWCAATGTDRPAYLPTDLQVVEGGGEGDDPAPPNDDGPDQRSAA